MEENTRLCLVGIIIFFTTLIECNTYVTTVYKFNSIRTKSEVHYLNSCAVSAYLENNHFGLPLFNKKDGSSQYVTIPILYKESRKSEWKMDRNGSLFPLSTSIYRMWQREEILKDWNTEKDGDLFGQKGNHNLNKNNTVLQVTFETKNVSKRYYEGFDVRFHFGSDSKQLHVEFRNSKELKVWRPNISSSKEENQDYISQYSVADNETFCEINMNKEGKITVTDLNNYKVHDTGVIVPPEFGDLTNVYQSYLPSDIGALINYKIINFDITNELDCLVSPWFKLKNDITLFILWYTTSEIDQNEINHTKIRIYLEEEFTQNSMLLEPLDVDQEDIDMKLLDEKIIDLSYYKRVLQRVDVKNAQNWSGQTRIRITTSQPSILIGNIWEGRNEAHVRLTKKHNCVKSDNVEIYTVPDKSMNSTANDLLFCYNGGQLNASRCICPPGFIDNQCETPCDENRFGQNCSLVCSESGSGCKGMVLCTELYGCSCAPGYHGEKCLEQCGHGFYGADCKQTCSIGCGSGCDIYTGNCYGECKMYHILGPKCDQFYSQLTEPPTFMDSNFSSVKLSINLLETNIRRPQFSDSGIPTFYIIQYRDDIYNEWKNEPPAKYYPGIHIVTVDGLKPGLHYYFNVQVLETLLNTNEKVSEGYTKCDDSDNLWTLNTTDITSTSITVSWEEQENDCPVLSYILLVEQELEDGSDTLQIEDIKATTYTIENLTPAQSYHIALKKLIVYGSSYIIASNNVTTSDERI